MSRAIDKFTDEMKLKRRRYRMSQEELGKKCNCSRLVITNIETGRTEPTLTTALKISYYLDISLDSLGRFLK